MKRIALLLLLIALSYTVKAQSTLGLSMEELYNLYQKSDMVAWEKGISRSGGTVITFKKPGGLVVIASYFAPVSGSIDDLVTRTVLIIPQELEDTYKNRLNNKFKAVGDNKWEDGEGMEVLWEPQGNAIAIVYQLKR